MIINTLYYHPINSYNALYYRDDNKFDRNKPKTTVLKLCYLCLVLICCF